MPISRRRRPLLVGESNPYGGDPHFALYPAPDGCSGHRLCCAILMMRRHDYLSAFNRVNLCEGEWDQSEADRTAARIVREVKEHGLETPIVTLGAKVTRSFGWAFKPFTVVKWHKIRYVILPHPSGLSRSWNDPESTEKAREAVASNCPIVSHLIGRDMIGRTKGDYISRH